MARRTACLSLLLCAHSGVGAPTPLNMSVLGQPYMGIGALSGGGGDTRLLVDYPENIRSDVFDILFKPKAGASLQIIKVEIGGDAQSTEGVEQSHERVRGDLNCSRGYEWMVLEEAKKRNPAIKTYGLSWGAPGWIGNGQYYSEDNIKYHLDWIYCAASAHNVDVSYMGIWNERSPDPEWIKSLRAALDADGYRNTRIVAADTDWSITNDMMSDPALAAAVDIVGAHYPGSAPPAAAMAALNSSFWASEMWNLGQKDDWVGAQYLASDLSRHATYGLSTSIVWCLIYSWYANLEYGFRTGTNSGAGHSLMTAAEPWSGYYEINPTLAVIAHWTQFTEIGWTFLSPSSTGMGQLPAGGVYVTLVNTHTPASVLEFSIVIQAMGVNSAQSMTFQIAGLTTQTLPTVLHVWQTTQSAYMSQQADITVAADGSFTVNIPADCMVSVTTTTGQGWIGTPSQPIPESQPFPWPYAETFDACAPGAYARYFSDMGGVWVCNPLPSELAATSNSGAASGYQQVIPIPPIAWATNPNPFTCIGNPNPPGGSIQSWTDYTLSVTGAIDSSAGGASATVTYQQTCTASASQRFALIGGDLTNTPATLQSVAFGLCLGFLGSDPQYAGATRVGLVNCSSPDVAAWTTLAATSQLASNGLCLDVYGVNTSLGARTIAWPCETPPGPNEQWKVTTQTGSTVSLQATETGYCVDLTEVSEPAPFLWITIRMEQYATFQSPLPQGYSLYLYASPNATTGGQWQLSTDKKQLAGGVTPFPVIAGSWYNMSLIAAGSNITAVINGARLATVTDSTYTYGLVTIGSGWHSAWYDSFAVMNNTADFV